MKGSSSYLCIIKLNSQERNFWFRSYKHFWELVCFPWDLILQDLTSWWRLLPWLHTEKRNVPAVVKDKVTGKCLSEKKLFHSNTYIFHPRSLCFNKILLHDLLFVSGRTWVERCRKVTGGGLLGGVCVTIQGGNSCLTQSHRKPDVAFKALGS